MNAYIYQAALHCEPCAIAIRDQLPIESAGDSDRYPQGPYPDGGGEADSPQCCGVCGVFLRNPLTVDGYAYVAELLAKDTRKPCILDDWREFYGFPLPDVIAKYLVKEPAS